MSDRDWEYWLLVLGAWGIIGAAGTELWTPLIALAIPFLAVFACIVLLFAIGGPAIALHQRLSGWWE